eukprot:1611159-Prymnesium_polylepis.1
MPLQGGSARGGTRRQRRGTAPRSRTVVLPPPRARLPAAALPAPPRYAWRLSRACRRSSPTRPAQHRRARNGSTLGG